MPTLIKRIYQSFILKRITFKVKNEDFPNRCFAENPISYSASGLYEWSAANAGIGVSGNKLGTDSLKEPELWLCQSRALFEAAQAALQNVPIPENMPEKSRNIFRCQYHAVGLMLIGLSMEVLLKAALINKDGVEEYIKHEKSKKIHNLSKLGDFVPNLSLKDLAILDCLTEFIYWAGKYPDPGSNNESKLEELLKLSEEHKITAKDIFLLFAEIGAKINHIFL